MAMIRWEVREDIPAIRDADRQAFGQPAEADLVQRLRRAARICFPWSAVESGRKVGHILFSLSESMAAR